jgi:hypothetical protein
MSKFSGNLSSLKQFMAKKVKIMSKKDRKSQKILAIRAKTVKLSQSRKWKKILQNMNR